MAMGVDPERLRALFALAVDRYSIFVQRLAGSPPPWTTDPLLRRYHLCNVFRDDDAVSQLIMEGILPANLDKWATVVTCRLVNHEDGLRQLFPGGRLTPEWARELQTATLNTNAYKINTPFGLNHRVGIAALIRRAQQRVWGPESTLEGAHTQLVTIRLGPFIAYQCAHDLKGSVLPAVPADRMKWTYMGSGAVRGALRLCGVDIAQWVADREYVKPKDGIRPGTLKESKIETIVREVIGANDHRAWGLGICRTVLAEAHRGGWPAALPPWTLGEAEHMLCEYDKVQRWRELGPAGARVFREPVAELF